MSKDIIIDLKVRVSVDPDALFDHIGGTRNISPHEALLNHVLTPIEDPCFDTPAQLRVIGVEANREVPV